MSIYYRDFLKGVGARSGFWNIWDCPRTLCVFDGEVKGLEQHYL